MQICSTEWEQNLTPWTANNKSRQNSAANATTDVQTLLVSISSEPLWQRARAPFETAGFA